MADIGTVVSLWRYPVKSMIGEELNSSYITDRGLIGDRTYAVVDKQTGKVARTIPSFRMASGEEQKDFLGVSASDEPVTITGFDLFRISEDGRKLAEMWQQWNIGSWP